MGAEGVGLKIQVVGGSCRVSVLFQLTFVRGFSSGSGEGTTTTQRRP